MSVTLTPDQSVKNKSARLQGDRVDIHLTLHQLVQLHLKVHEAISAVGRHLFGCQAVDKAD